MFVGERLWEIVILVLVQCWVLELEWSWCLFLPGSEAEKIEGSRGNMEQSSQEEELVRYRWWKEEKEGKKRGFRNDWEAEFASDWELEEKICAEWERRWGQIQDTVNGNDELKKRKGREKMESKKKCGSEKVPWLVWECWKGTWGKDKEAGRWGRGWKGWQERSSS